MSVPVLKGLRRPDLIWEVDPRILVLAVLTFVVGVAAPLLFLVGIAIYGIGRVLAGVSPHLLSDLGCYMRWRFIAWDGYLPDEGCVVVAVRVKKK